MPAHNGVRSKLYPCSGSQMPCSQIISMNCSPPRLTDASRPAKFPVENALIRNNDMLNIGSSMRDSYTQKTIRTIVPPISPARTHGLVHPMLWPP